jgi:non-specific serine/threonine protein kinase
VGDDRELAQALGTWGSTLLRAGDVAAARETLRRAEALARATGDPMSLSGVAITRAQIAMWIDHDLEAAWALTEENLQLGTRIGDPAIVARSALGLGWLAAAEGDWPAARGHFADSHRLFADIGDRLFANVAQSGLADAARRMDELPEAEAQYRAVIAFWHEIGQRPAVARCLECLAFMAAAEGRVERAGALFGAAEVLRENVGAAMAPDEQAEYAHELAGLRAHLSEQMAVFEAAWRVGRRMRYEEAVALAI